MTLSKKRKLDERDKNTPANRSSTLDRWFTPRLDPKVDDGSDSDEIAVATGHKRLAPDRDSSPYSDGQDLPDVAWVDLPDYDSRFVAQFSRHEAAQGETIVCNDAFKTTTIENDDAGRDIVVESSTKTATLHPGSHTSPQQKLRRRTARSSYTEFLADDYSEILESEQEQSAHSVKSKKRGKRRSSSSDSQYSVPDSVESADAGTSSGDPLSDIDQAESITDHSERSAKPSVKRKSTLGAKRGPAVKRPVAHSKPSSANMKKLLTRAKGETRGLDTSLPPLFEIGDIFSDMVQRARTLGLDKATDNLRSRKLRVATMCSGTESPLLALDMIVDLINRSPHLKGAIEIEHVFSAEIVPFKQAYIQRNFAPQIIFRDITELIEAVKSDNPVATNAFGAKVPVPTDIDILIAGTSCVDFSRLNNSRKGINGGGESDKTWHAVLAYCRTVRPTIVLLENVRNAEWDTMLEHYVGIEYESAGVLVDTKDYYIPHTRQRGYMACFDKHRLESSKAAGKRAGQTWQSLMEKLKRPASSPITAFLLPSDQLRHRSQLVDDDQPTREVDWAQCEITQMEYRQEQRLGNARPYTNWQEGGGVLPPDHTVARQWYRNQVERVLDTIDGALLRKANANGGMYDVRYKTRIWNLSQNIYRDNDHQPFGITGCITPSGCFFISDSGRVLAPEETLKLQGLPIDRISFTTESAAEMQDLAGNAMTTTVIGASILSALIVGYKLIGLPNGTADELPTASVAMLQLDPRKAEAADGHDFPEHLTDPCAPTGDNLKSNNVAAAMTSTTAPDACDLPLAQLLTDAALSGRRCTCEGDSDTTKKAIQQCKDCGHTTCTACGGNPAHTYQGITPKRLDPSVFRDCLKSTLPLALKFSDAEEDKTAMVNRFFGQSKVAGSAIRRYVEIVQKAAKGVFTFCSTRRTHCWTATYRTENARLELVVRFDRTAEWQLYALPPKDLAGNDWLRTSLTQPIAVAKLSHALLEAKWHWRVPSLTSAPLNVQGSGSRVPSWWCRNQMPDFKDHSVPEFLNINVQLEKNKSLESTINGRYQYLPRCGKACDSLFQKLGDRSGPTLFLFLDPTSTGSPNDDCFVFSASRHDLEYNEARPIVARIQAPWRPWSENGKLSKATLVVDDVWHPSSRQIKAVNIPVQLVQPQQPSSVLLACTKTQAFIRCEVARSVSPLKEQVIRPHDTAFYTQHAWMFEVMRGKLPKSTDTWQKVNFDTATICEPCAPSKPHLRWRLQEGGKLCPYEDPESAAQYERSIKLRPDGITLATTHDEATSYITLTLNIASLAHRATARLSQVTTTNSQCHWRFITKSRSDRFSLKPFKLQATPGIVPHKADVGMSVLLFPQQCFALAWMREQELGIALCLEHVEDETIPSLGWRAEVKAQKTIHVRGGICADHPGFGKTITSLALIHVEYQDDGPHKILGRLKARDTKLIACPATLIVCPATLIAQWTAEIEDKLGSLKGVIAINLVKSFSNFTVADFEKAKIVIINRSVLGSDAYIDRLAAFAAVPPPLTTSGRSFTQWLTFATKQIPTHVELLVQRGKEKLKSHIKATYKQNLESKTFEATIPSRRLRGAAYSGSVAKKSQPKQPRATGTVDTSTIGTPLLEMFYFNRLIVDEFHQYEPKEYASIVTGLKADSRWGLSATPALGDLYEVSQIASLLGVPLPIGSDQKGVMKVKNARALRREMTDFERFDSMRQMASDAVHQHIYETDQRFLDAFVRQNIADFDTYAFTDHLVPVSIDLAHRAVYTELSQHLNSSNMRIKKGRSRTTDRYMLINKAMSDSQTAEEALSKAATFSEHAAITSLIERRREELAQMLDVSIPAAIARARTKESASLGKLKSRIEEADLLGDAQTKEEILALMSGLKAKVKSVDKAITKDPPIADLNTKCKQLVIVRRSLRYLEGILKLRAAVSTKDVVCSNDRCKGQGNREQEQRSDEHGSGAVSSLCGHIICRACYQSSKTHGIQHCLADGCTSPLQDYHLLWARKLGPMKSTLYGAKMEAALELLNQIKRKGDQAILFVQFASQLVDVEAVLQSSNIAATVVKKSCESAAQIRDFQTTRSKTVIVLNASDETAAGSNLQNANHVIFLSPLLRDSQYGYESTMAQAIGRVRRHGQKKEIHVYRLVALDTIDVDILEHRERRRDALVEHDAPAFKPPQAVVGGQVERTQLVREHGRFSLQPRSWLVGTSKDGSDKVRGRHRVLGWEDFSSLVKFSRAFTEDDDD